MEKEIIEGNKLIAVFDGKFVERIGEHRQVVYQGFNLKDHGVVNCLTEHLRYNSSWDWLMPCVVHMREMVHEKENFLKMAGMFMNVQEALLQVDITILFKAAVEFIKWYNDNKANP